MRSRLIDIARTQLLVLVVIGAAGCATVGKVAGGATGAVLGVVGGLGCGPAFVVCSPLYAVRAGEGGAEIGGSIGGFIERKAREAANAPAHSESDPQVVASQQPLPQTSAAHDESKPGVTSGQAIADYGNVAGEFTYGKAYEAASQQPLPQSAAPQVEPNPVVTSGPAVKGATWVYEREDRAYARRQSRLYVQATRVDEHTVGEFVSSNAAIESRSIDRRATDFVVLPVDGAEALVEFAPYLAISREEEFETRNIVVAGYPSAKGDPEWVVRVIGKPTWEEVEVPAGSFRALRLELEGRRARVAFTPLVTNKLNVRVWYAPAVDRYVKLETREWLPSRLSADHVVQLSEYRAP